ncbi:MAG: sigma-54-dependent Fis family transcriptional regulator, partial [Planctomycetes bacterium]|nr:sigma-54-dependent Fis family transcriptional regulator [Planctomycetota bacterium]
RELENEIARTLILAMDRPELGVDSLSEKVRGAAVAAELEALKTAGTMPQKVEALERRLIAEARLATAGNKSKMARILGLSREGLRKKLMRYDMQ